MSSSSRQPPLSSLFKRYGNRLIATGSKPQLGRKSCNKNLASPSQVPSMSVRSCSFSTGSPLHCVSGPKYEATKGKGLASSTCPPGLNNSCAAAHKRRGDAQRSNTFSIEINEKDSDSVSLLFTVSAMSWHKAQYLYNLRTQYQEVENFKIKSLPSVLPVDVFLCFPKPLAKVVHLVSYLLRPFKSFGAQTSLSLYSPLHYSFTLLCGTMLHYIHTLSYLYIPHMFILHYYSLHDKLFKSCSSHQTS